MISLMIIIIAVFQDNNRLEQSCYIARDQVCPVVTNARRQAGQLQTKQLTVKSSRGRRLGSLGPE